MKRALQIFSLAGLVACVLIVCAACGAKHDEPPVFERGAWALSSFDGMQAPYHYGTWNYDFDYNERGQIVESRKFSDAVNIVNGQSMTCTWSDDGLSYECSYTLISGNFGEISRSGTSKATFQAEYDELSATYTAHGDRLPHPWKRDGGTVSYALEYRADGTLKHKEVKGYMSADSQEVYDYDEHGNLVHYERFESGEDAPSEIRTYDISYEEGVPKGASVTKTFPASNDDSTSDTKESQGERSYTYDLVLHTDDKGNIVSADCDGKEMATMSWTYIEKPDSLSRLRIQGEVANAFELL